MHGPGVREYAITVEDVGLGLNPARAWVHKACGRHGQATIWGPGPEALRYARRHHRCPLAVRGAWVDCNEQGQPHDWPETPELRALDRSYWKCRRCPVSTMTTNRGPEPLPEWTKGFAGVPVLSNTPTQPVARPKEVLR
jgi:hypothetical protein